MEDQVERLFDQALDITADEREAWLESQCRSNQSLLRHVRALLTAHVANLSDERVGPLPVRMPAEETPASIGEYKVIGAIGEGGAGAVFDARHEITGRRAAVKLLRTGFATNKQRLRFQLEAEILGRLSHPSIAHLYQAGVAEVRLMTGSGLERVASRRPFIAMEYIDGNPISSWSSNQQLSIRQRVALIREAARAVEHAHQRGVVHRDLKPANIMVTLDGAVKVVDFGIAKLVAGAMSGSSEHVMTITGAVAGTPAFMSPEQLLGQSDQIDLTTDVYGLGATLYYLLSGSSPLSSTDLLATAEIISILAREIAPIRSRNDKVDADLAAVVHKAIERSPSRRYASAAELGADLDRWLAGQPTVARPLRFVGRTARYIQRNKWRSLAIAALSAATLSAIGSAVFVASSLARERAALREQQASLAFMNDMLIRTSPEALGSFGSDRKLSDLVIDAEHELTRSPLSARAQASVWNTLARINLALGRINAATANAEQAIKLFESVGESGVRRIEAMETLALVEKEANHLDRAAKLRFDAWNWRKKNLEADPESIRAGVEVTVLETEAGYPNATTTPDVKQSIQTLQTLKRRRGNAWTQRDELALIRALELGAQFYIILLDRPVEAGTIVDDAISASREANGPDHPGTVRLMRIKAISLLRMGDYAAAEPLLKSVHEQFLSRLGERHPNTLNLEEMLAGIRAALGDPQTALAEHRRLTPILQEVMGPRHMRVVSSKINTVVALRLLGRLNEADAAVNECIESARNMDGPNRYMLRACYRELALLRVDQGRLQEAAEIMHQYVFEKSPVYPNFEGYYGEAGEWMLDYVEILEKLGDLEQARTGAWSASISLLKGYGPSAPLTRRAEAVWNRLKTDR